MHRRSKPIVRVRRPCQATCINDHEVKKLEHHQPKKAKITTQPLLDHFDWKTNFMFCGKTCIVDEKHPERGKDVHRAEFKEYRELSLANVKRDDEEAHVIEHGDRSCSDFIAAEAHYHNTCPNLFKLKMKKKLWHQAYKID